MTFEITTTPGTYKKLLEIGVRDLGQPGTKSLNLRGLKSGWKRRNAFFKMENNRNIGLPRQINIGIGNGKALEIFNSPITNYKVIP